MITINNKKICESCFAEVHSEGTCPYCGFSENGSVQSAQTLHCGNILMGRYIVGRVIGKGGFGITYLAYDVQKDKVIAIKEYFPIELAVRQNGSTKVAVLKSAESLFKKGSGKFYDEASFLSKFNGHPNIVSVYEFFYENNTVYFTMEYLHGITLKDYVLNYGKISIDKAVDIGNKVCSALSTIHSENILHRDISPDNIMLCADNVKLIDFGASRQVFPEGSQLLSVILKPGFAPIEQYQKKGNQGPWTDLYALGGTLYYALTGEIPDDPMTRFEDDSCFAVNMLGTGAEEYNMWEVLKKASALNIADRYANAEEMRKALMHIYLPTNPNPAPKTIIEVIKEKISGFINSLKK